MLEEKDIDRLIEAFSQIFVTKEDLQSAVDDLAGKMDGLLNSVDAYAHKADAYFQGNGYALAQSRPARKMDSSACRETGRNTQGLAAAVDCSSASLVSTR